MLVSWYCTVVLSPVVDSIAASRTPALRHYHPLRRAHSSLSIPSRRRAFPLVETTPRSPPPRWPQTRGPGDATAERTLRRTVKARLAVQEALWLKALSWPTALSSELATFSDIFIGATPKAHYLLWLYCCNSTIEVAWLLNDPSCMYCI